MYHSSSRGTESLKDNCSRVCTYFQTAVRSFKCHQNFMLFKVHLFFGRRLYYLFKYQWSEIDLPWKMILIAFESLVGYLTVRVGNIIVLELIVVRLRGPMAPRELGPPSTFFYHWGLRLGQGDKTELWKRRKMNWFGQTWADEFDEWRPKTIPQTWVFLFLLSFLPAGKLSRGLIIKMRTKEVQNSKLNRPN